MEHFFFPYMNMSMLNGTIYFPLIFNAFMHIADEGRTFLLICVLKISFSSSTDHLTRVA